jgi:nucleoside-diphosphate-sugar epimerase
MKILITGNNGYIGSVLTEILVKKGHDVIGLDADFYKECSLYPPDFKMNELKKDIRMVGKKDLDGFQAIIHLAALSNDPLGEFDREMTDEINHKSTVRLAEMAKEAGVERFVFSSSQSIYGISKTGEDLGEENLKNPITAYAKAKWDAECELKKLSSGNFTVVCFRPSTVFGVSPNLRCDIVFNNLVASAYTTGKIEIKSDGTPWRPVVHIRDVCQAFEAGLLAPPELIAGESFNVGIENGNYTVKDLALAAQAAVPGSTLVFTGEHGSDSRTYRVSFKKILTVLKDYFKPEWNLNSGGRELVDFFKKINFTEEMFRGRVCNRLPQLKYLIETKKLDDKFFWIN